MLTAGNPRAELRGPGAAATSQLPAPSVSLPSVEWLTTSGLVGQADLAWRNSLFVTAGLRVERSDAFLSNTTYSLLPIVKAFVGAAGIDVTLKDISLAGRIIATFPDKVTPAQKQNDDLTWLGELTLKPEANIMKLPNISASIPQLKATIAELQSQGYDLPAYPENPQTDEEREVRARYDKVKGSDRKSTRLNSSHT